MRVQRLFEVAKDMATEADGVVAGENPASAENATKKRAPKKKTRNTPKRAPNPVEDDNSAEGKRRSRPYPIVSFNDATTIADAIFRFAGGQERVRRLTLLEKMERNPSSSATRMLITNSGKYGITTGSYSAEFLQLTRLGGIACNPASLPVERMQARFSLAISEIPPFKFLYDAYKGKKLPAHEIIKDTLSESGIEVENPKECIDLFVVNVQDLGLLRLIASAETLISVEQAFEELGDTPPPLHVSPRSAGDAGVTNVPGTKWETTCFYIAPIGDEGSPPRRHSDLFQSYLIEPALQPLGLKVIRADEIAEPGMITSMILEHLRRSRLVIADLSMLNPNVFYEMAIRHAAKLPIVQIIQKVDRLPFDVNQVNSIVIDNTDIYSFTPKLETYRSEITTLAKRALEDPQHVGNPISVFYPDFWK